MGRAPWISVAALSLFLAFPQLGEAIDYEAGLPYNYTYLVPSRIKGNPKTPRDQDHTILNDGHVNWENQNGAYLCGKDEKDGTAVVFSLKDQRRPLLDFRGESGNRHVRITQIVVHFAGNFHTDEACDFHKPNPDFDRRRRSLSGHYIRGVTLTGRSAIGPERRVRYHRHVDVDGVGLLEYDPNDTPGFYRYDAHRRRTVVMSAEDMVGCVQTLEISNIMPEGLELAEPHPYDDEPDGRPLDPAVSEIVVHGEYDCGPPSLVLNPPLEQWIYQDHVWAEPGARCLAFDGTPLRYSLVGAVLWNKVGSYLLKYDCKHSGFTVSETRLVIVLRPPVMDLVGRNVIRKTADMSDFDDPEACCAHELFPGLDSVTAFRPGLGTANNTPAAYYCADKILELGNVPPKERRFIVDQAPVAVLHGASKVNITVDSPFKDDGLRCADPEEGWIPSMPQVGNKWMGERLEVVDVTSRYSPHADSDVGWSVSSEAPCDKPWPAQPHPRVIVQGMEHSSAGCCRQCFAAGRKTEVAVHRWVQLDLGTTRVVHQILLFHLAALPGMAVRVGFSRCSESDLYCGNTNVERVGDGECTPTSNDAPGSAAEEIGLNLDGCKTQCLAQRACTAYSFNPSNFKCVYYKNREVTGSTNVSSEGSCYRFRDFTRGRQCAALVQRSSPNPLDRSSMLLKINCQRPIAGRYISLWAVSTLPISICGIQVWGSLGPAAPSAFSLSHAYECESIHADEAISFRLASTDGNNPVYESGITCGHGNTFQESNQKCCIEGSCNTDPWRFRMSKTGSDAWCLVRLDVDGNPDGTGIACETLTSLHGFLVTGTSSDILPGVRAWGRYPDGTPGGCFFKLTFDFHDACTWLYGNGKSQGPQGLPDVAAIECTDGTQFDETHTFSACDAHGGVQHCNNVRQMCPSGCKDDCGELDLLPCGGADASVTAPTPPASPATTNPTKWRTTEGCDPDGKVIFSFAGRVKRSSGQSGYCDCDGNGVRSFWEPAFTCSELASGSPTCDEDCGTLLNPFRYEAEGAGSRVEVTPQGGKINTQIAQTTLKMYSCVDRMGNRNTVSREVAVGCESPNPDSTFPGAGGNDVFCKINIASKPDVRSSAACGQECLAQDEESSKCQAYTYNQDNSRICNLWTECDNRYISDGDVHREAAYCRRENQPPAITINEGGQSEVDYAPSGVWREPEPPCTCFDAEDPTQPECITTGVQHWTTLTVTKVDHARTIPLNEPGLWTIFYRCEDDHGQQAEAYRSVVVRGQCAQPLEKANIHTTEPCVGLTSSVKVGRGGECTVQCQDGFTPSTAKLKCEADGTYQASFTPSQWSCGEAPCVLPTVENARQTFDELDPCEGFRDPRRYLDPGSPGCPEGENVLCINDGAQCKPMCGEQGKDVPSVSVITCEKGELSSSYQCLTAAHAPSAPNPYNPETTSVSLNWSPGKAYSCVHKGWVVHHRYRDPDANTFSDWELTDGCQITDTCEETESCQCTAINLMEGGTYQFKVRRECEDLESILGDKLKSPEVETPSSVELKFVEPATTIFRIPPSEEPSVVIKENPLQALVGYAVAAQPGTLPTEQALPGKPSAVRLAYEDEVLEMTNEIPSHCLGDKRSRCVKYDGIWYAALDGTPPDDDTRFGIGCTEEHTMPKYWDLARSPGAWEVAKAHPWAAYQVVFRRMPQETGPLEPYCQRTSRACNQVDNCTEIPCAWIGWTNSLELRSDTLYNLTNLQEPYEIEVCRHRVLIEYMPRWYLKDSTYSNCLRLLDTTTYKPVIGPCHDKAGQNHELEEWFLISTTYPNIQAKGGFWQIAVFTGEEQYCLTWDELSDELTATPCLMQAAYTVDDVKIGNHLPRTRQLWRRFLGSDKALFNRVNTDCLQHDLTMKTCNGVDDPEWTFVPEVMVFKKWCMNEQAAEAQTPLSSCDQADSKCHAWTSPITAPVLSDGAVAAEAAGAQIVGERILSAMPAPAFFVPDCVYQVILHPHLLETIQKPAKPTTPSTWRFIYEETVPEMGTQIEEQSQKKLSIQVFVTFTRRTEFVCLASVAKYSECSLDMDAIVKAQSQEPPCTCDVASGNTINKPVCPGCCVPHSDPDAGEFEQCCLSKWTTPSDLDEESGHSKYNVQIGDSTEARHAGHILLPGYGYTLRCAGHLESKSWIRTEVRPAERSQTQFKTLADTDDSTRNVKFNVTPVCVNGSRGESREENLAKNDLDSGLTLIVVDWFLACNEYLADEDKGILRPGGPHATFEIQADIETGSDRAKVIVFGPDESEIETRKSHVQSLSFAYGQHNGLALLGVRFNVCSFAHESNKKDYPCIRNDIQIRLVDVQFEFDSIRLGDEEFGAERNDNTNVGQQMQITTTSTDPNTEWQRVEIWIGCKDCSGTCTFWQATGDASWVGKTQTFTFTLEGQGYDLPVILYWQTAAFPTKKFISFKPPVLHMHDGKIASINEDTQLKADISNMPRIEARNKVKECVHMHVFKAGQSQNLCSETEFLTGPSTNNVSATCYLRPAALSNIEVQMLAKTYQSTDYAKSRAKSVAHSGKVSYEPPTIIHLRDPLKEQGADQGNRLEMGEVAQRDDPQILVKGEDLPEESKVWMEGASAKGYSMWLFRNAGDDRPKIEDALADGVELCRDIEWINMTMLRCRVHNCLTVKHLTEIPRAWVFLGDLVAATGFVTLRLPGPEIKSIHPTKLNDTSPSQTLYLNGSYFGQQKCDPLRGTGVQFIGDEEGALVEVGDFRQLCKVTSQTQSSLTCVVSGAITYARDMERSLDLPPPRRSHTTHFTFKLGPDFESMNDKDQQSDSGLLPLQVGVELWPCPEGYVREHEQSYVCVKCAKGRYSVAYNPTGVQRGIENEWPLSCAQCEGATYQDHQGRTACELCPANTKALSPKDSITACHCKPGYYSKYYDFSRGRTMPGHVCSGCHESDMVADPDIDEQCGGNIPIATLCDEPRLPTCVAGGVAGFRVCKAYCPGGTAWPLAKPTFYLYEERDNRRLQEIAGFNISDLFVDNDPVKDGRRLEYLVGLEGSERRLTNATVEVFKERTPQISRCDPPEACLEHNKCHQNYEEGSILCAKCAIFHYPDKYSGKCIPCGIEQQIGTVVMSVVATFLLLGGLIGTSMMLRMQADLQLRQQLKQWFNDVFGMGGGDRAAHEVILDKILRREKRITVFLGQKELGRSLRWSRHKDLGIVFRVTDVATHVAGIFDDSPAKDTVNPNWKLLTVNGKAVRASSEMEVKKRIAEEHTPLRLVFRENELRHKGMMTTGDVADDRKMLIMLVGIMNTFQQISTMNFKWPKAFIMIAEALQQLSFNFNFFQPECSVSSLSFMTKWLATLVVPYLVSIPLIVSFVFVRKTMHSKTATADSRKIKDGLLLNAFARTLCMAIIIFLPVHLDQLLTPIGCRNVGSTEKPNYVVDAAPHIQCSFDTEDENNKGQWAKMIGVSTMGMLVVAFGTAFLFTCIIRSYYWQFGSQPRHAIPFYVGITEVSAFGQKGYHREVRNRVLSNIMAVKAFDTKNDRLGERAQLFTATVALGARSRRVQEALEKSGSHLSGQSAKARFEARFGTGLTVERSDNGQDESAEVKRLKIIKGRANFLQSAHTRRVEPGDATKSGLLSYGWIFFINLYCRQLLTLVTIKLSKTNLVVVGAGFQILVLAMNITLLFIHAPYKAEKITVVETGLLLNLSAMLWCAVLQELLSSHVNAHLYQKHINNFNTVIEVLAVVLVFVLFVVPVYQGWLIIAKTLAGEGDPNEKLNELYFANSLAKEIAAKSENIMKADEKEIEAKVKEQREKLALQRRADALRAVLSGKVIEATATENEKKAVIRIQATVRGWLIRRKMDELRTRAQERIEARAVKAALEAERERELQAARLTRAAEQQESPEAARQSQLQSEELAAAPVDDGEPEVEEAANTEAPDANEIGVPCADPEEVKDKDEGDAEAEDPRVSKKRSARKSSRSRKSKVQMPDEEP